MLDELENSNRANLGENMKYMHLRNLQMRLQLLLADCSYIPQAALILKSLIEIGKVYYLRPRT